MNQYFIDNPEMILGNMEMISTRFGYDSACISDGEKLEDKLERAISNIHAEVKVTNVNEDYFEIEARNQKEAALIVAKFVIENEIIEIDTTIPIEFEVEEIEEEPEENFEEDDDELDAESFMKMQCENCKHYCPYCGKCFLGE